MKRLLAVAVASMMLASACGSDDPGPITTSVATTTTTVATTTTTAATDQPTSTTRADTPTTAGGGEPVLVTVGLRTFASCDDILNYYIENALELVGPTGWVGAGG